MGSGESLKIQSILLIFLTFILLLDFIIVAIGNFTTVEYFGITLISLKSSIPYWSTWYAISQDYIYLIVLYIPLIIMYYRPSIKLFFESLIGLEIIAYIAVLTGAI